jgi:hypothetical protein
MPRGSITRAAAVAAVILVSSCASDRLSLAPPAGVDFSGNWQLNEADSDDTSHLMQSAAAQSDANPGGGAGGGNSGGRGRRGGPQAGGYPGLGVPATPSMGVLGAGLRWPGKRLVIKQVAGVVAFTSDGRNRVCQPSDAAQKSSHHGNSSDRDAPLPAAREAPPPICGWLEKTLIVRNKKDPDDDRPPFEERYSLADDGQRLIEVVGFKGGNSNGFTASRVWDRVPQP